MKIFNDVSSLAAASLTANQIVKVKGVGEYRIQDSGAGITLANSKIAVPQASGTAVNVKQFGAVGDGVTDDTAAIQAALTAASSSSSKVVYFPSGEYECSTAITIPTNVSLIGEDCRVYHYFYDANNPRMPVLRFINDTDGLVFSAQFFKTQIKNLGIWSGLAAGTSTKVGLKLTTEDATLVSSSTIEGLGNIFENVEVAGFKTGVLIWGAYSWYQHFKDFQTHNCQVGFDIECRSTHHTRLDNIYINVDSGSPITHSTRRGIIMRAGGRLIIDNAIIENMGYSFEIAPVIYSDLPEGAGNKQLYINNLYTEAMLQGVFLFTASGYVKLQNCRASYGFYDSFCNFIRLSTASPTEKTYISMDELQFVGNASPDNRRLRKMFSCSSANTPSTYEVDLTNVEVTDNEFEVFWEVNYPPTHIAFKERDNAGNLVECFQRSTETSRAYAVLTNDLGNVPTNSLQWTTKYATTVNLATMTNQLTTVDPIRPANTNRKPVFYDNVAALNGTTKNFNDYSGIRYVNYGAGPTPFAITIDTTYMRRGDEFLITDAGAGVGAICNATFGSQTFQCPANQFIVVRKIIQAGAGSTERYQIVSQGTAA